MAYYRPDGIQAFRAPDGGFDLVLTRGGREYNRHVLPNDWVTHIEAGVILRPQVTRVAVYKWVQNGRLKGGVVDGTLVIRIQDLLRFAAKNDYGVAGTDSG